MATGRTLHAPSEVTFRSEPRLINCIPNPYKLGVLFKMAALRCHIFGTVAYPAVSTGMHKGLIEFIASSERR